MSETLSPIGEAKVLAALEAANIHAWCESTGGGLNRIRSGHIVIVDFLDNGCPCFIGQNGSEIVNVGTLTEDGNVVGPDGCPDLDSLPAIVAAVEALLR